MSRNKKKYHGWKWWCRPLLDGQLQLSLFLPQGAWLNPGNNTPSIVRYVPACISYTALKIELKRMTLDMEVAL